MRDEDTRTTIGDVAKAAGVSIATVSKVLNGRGGISRETRNNVRAAMDRLHYQRRRRGAQNIHHLVEVLLDDLQTPWAEEVLRGVIESLPKPFVPVVSARADNDWSMESWLQDIINRRSAGAIIPLVELSAQDQDRLSRSGIPCVLVDPTGEVPSGVPTIGSDDYGGARQAGQYLLSMGHQRIGYIGGPDYLRTSHARLDGFRSALENEGINLDPDLITAGEFRLEDGKSNGLRLLDNRDPPTAIFAASDMQAQGVYDAAWERGLRIPEDISVVGFDDLPATAALRPELTTVYHAVREMAGLGAKTLCSIIAGDKDALKTNIKLGTHLVIRSSVKDMRHPISVPLDLRVPV